MMRQYKDLFMALLPIIGLVVIGFVAYILFKAFPDSNKSGDDDIEILMGVWMLFIPVVLAFVAIKSDKTNKK